MAGRDRKSSGRPDAAGGSGRGGKGSGRPDRPDSSGRGGQGPGRGDSPGGSGRGGKGSGRPDRPGGSDRGGQGAGRGDGPSGPDRGGQKRAGGPGGPGRGGTGPRRAGDSGDSGGSGRGRSAPGRTGGPGGAYRDARPGRPPRSEGPEEPRARLGGNGDDRAGGERSVSARTVYGRNAVREAIRGPREIRRLYTAHASDSGDWGVDRIEVVAAERLTELCGSDGHQGVCAEVSPYVYADASELLTAPDAIIVALDEVTDPQNLGAICRSAECAGATGVVLPERRSAEVTGAVCKASAGAVEHLPIAQVRNLADFLGEAKAAGLWCYGAAAEGRRSYDAPDYQGGVVVVLGAEGKGLRPRVAASCDELISLPLRGRIESLNVSATAAVMLYEILQRRSRA